MTKGPKYTMRIKTTKELFTITENPGPGTYENKEGKVDGNQLLS